MTIEQKFNQLLANIPNQKIEVSDSSNVYQCMDLAYLWVFVLCYPKETIQHRYAYEVFTKASLTTIKYFDLIPNTPKGVPSVGDLAIFNKGTGIGIAGHIAIVAKKPVGIMEFTSLDQNWRQMQPPTLTVHNYNKVLGWLHPRVVN